MRSSVLKRVGGWLSLGVAAYSLVWAVIMLGGVGKSFETGLLWLFAAAVFAGVGTRAIRN
jgi:hypothetical protein